MPDTVTLTREWFTMLEELPSVQSRWNVLSAVASFAFDGREPEDLSAIEKGIFKSMKFQIQKRNRDTRYYTNHKTKASESGVGISVGIRRRNPASESDGELPLNIKEVNSNLDNNLNNNINNITLGKGYKGETSGKLAEPPPKRKIFVPPTLEEVTAYCLERFNGVDPESFISFYQSKDWFIGKNKMKDWKAAVRTWERARKNQPTTTTYRNQRPVRDYSGI